MRNVLRLNIFEEFELWLQSLQAYCRGAGKRLGKSETDAQANFRTQLKGVVDVTGYLIQRCPRVVEPELGPIDPANPPEDADDTRAAKMKQFADFFQLWEFLRRCRIIGASMVRHHSVSLTEYRAFGAILAGQIEDYCQTRTHQSLLKKHQSGKYQHVIDRDLVCSIEIDGVREELTKIFEEFLRILSYLEYFQNSIRHSFKYHRLFILLHYFQSRYQSLLKALEQSHQYLGYSLPQLSEEVTSVRFALKMEIKRIFGTELKGVESFHKLGDIYSRIETGLGLLTHITQQSFVGLVGKLNSAFDDRTLFADVRDQQAEGLRLMEDLNLLYKLTVEASREREDDTFQKVVAEMDRFQAGSMRLLFFKDWEPVEEFAEELHDARKDQRAFVLHRLEVFFSALIGEVSKRASLNTVNRAVGS